MTWRARLITATCLNASGPTLAAAPMTSDDGADWWAVIVLYEVFIIFGQLFAARNSISLCHMYMQTQLPYGYIHLILVIVQFTCLANSIYCGIHLGIGTIISASNKLERISHPRVWHLSDREL